MPRPKGVPRLLTRRSPSTGALLAHASFDGRFFSFGHAGAEATQKFLRTLAEWSANGGSLRSAKDEELTVEGVVSRFLEHATQEYREVEVYKLRRALDLVVQEFQFLPAAKFDVACLENIQRRLANQPCSI